MSVATLSCAFGTSRAPGAANSGSSSLRSPRTSGCGFGERPCPVTRSRSGSLSGVCASASCAAVDAPTHAESTAVDFRSLPITYLIIDGHSQRRASHSGFEHGGDDNGGHSHGHAAQVLSKAASAYLEHHQLGNVPEEAPEEESDSVRVTVSSSLHGITFEQRTKGGPVTVASVSPTGSAAKSAWVKPGCELVACSRALNLAGSFEAADFSCAGQELEEVLTALASNARCGFEQMALVLREPIMVADQEETGEADTLRVTLPIAHGITFEQRTPGGPVTVASVSATGSAAKSAWVKPGCELLGCTRALNVRGSFEAVDFSCAGQDLEEVLTALASNERCGTGALSLLLREPAPAAEPTAPETEEAETVRLTLSSSRHGITFEQRTKGGPVTVASVSPTGSAAKSAWVKPGCELVACSRALNLAGSFESVEFSCAGQELEEVLTALASNARCGFKQMALVLREPAVTSPHEEAEAEAEADTLRVTLPMPHGVTFEQRTPGGPVTVASVSPTGSAAKSAWVKPGCELLGCTRALNVCGSFEAVDFSCAGQDLEEVLTALASNERCGTGAVTLVLRAPPQETPTTPVLMEVEKHVTPKTCKARPHVITTVPAFQ